MTPEGVVVVEGPFLSHGVEEVGGGALHIDA